jgi:hypothetical protein
LRSTGFGAGADNCGASIRTGGPGSRWGTAVRGSGGARGGCPSGPRRGIFIGEREGGAPGTPPSLGILIWVRGRQGSASGLSAGGRVDPEGCRGVGSVGRRGSAVPGGDWPPRERAPRPAPWPGPGWRDSVPEGPRDERPGGPPRPPRFGLRVSIWARSSSV